MITKRCGNEGEWPHNTPQQTRDREFLQKGISFLTEVLDHQRGLDLDNAALIFCIPVRDFCVTSGNHRWEFVIFEERGEIQAKCCRMPTARWLWNAARNCWGQIVDYARNFAFQALTGRPYVSETALTAGVRCPRANCRELNGSTARFCNRCGRPLI